MQANDPPHLAAQFFESRTRLHIELVRGNLEQLSGFMGIDPALLTRRAIEHDASKFTEAERLAYTWIGWKYLNHCIDQPLTEDIEDIIRAGWWQHVTKNAHHPEFHTNVNQMANIDLIVNVS